jgi:hypothetical protein
MAKRCYFALAGGLNGCYMPDSDFGHYAVTTRRDLMQAVRDALAFYDLPKSAMGEVKWKRVWDHAKRHGTSSLHFSVGNKQGFGVQFMGLTAAEYAEREEREDY